MGIGSVPETTAAKARIPPTKRTSVTFTEEETLILCRAIEVARKVAPFINMPPKDSEKLRELKDRILCGDPPSTTEKTP